LKEVSGRCDAQEALSARDFDEIIGRVATVTQRKRGQENVVVEPSLSFRKTFKRTHNVVLVKVRVKTNARIETGSEIDRSPGNSVGPEDIK